MKMTKVLIALLMVTTGLFALVTEMPTTSGLPPANGNWVISVPETVTGGSYNVTNGNILVQNGGTLTLDGTEVLINDTNGPNGMQYFVEVQSGGRLVMKNKALIRSSMNGSNYYFFYIRQGASASITNSNISDVGNQNNWQNEGVYIQSDNVTIDHTNITRGFYGIIVDTSSPTITYNMINNNDAIAIDINTGNPKIQHNDIINNGKSNNPWWQNFHAINIWNSKPIIENNNIRSNGWKNQAPGWGIWAQISNLTLRNNTIQANGGGGVAMMNHVTGIVADNTLTDNVDVGILIEDVSDPMIINNNVRAPSRHSLQVDGVSTPYVSGNYFNTTNDICVHVDGPSTLTLVKNDIKVWSLNMNNYDGIDVQDSGVAIIKDNTIYVDRGNGMDLWNWAQGTITGNTVYARNGNGIQLWNWATGQVDKNKVNSSNDAFDVWDFAVAQASDNLLVSRNNRGINTGWWTEVHASGGSITSMNEGVSIGANVVATVTDMVIAATNDNGVQITGKSKLGMSGNTISSKNFDGLYVMDSIVDVVNSSIRAGGPDIHLGNSAPVTPALIRALNTTFNESDTMFDNDNSRLNVSWYAEKIWAEWQNARRVPGAALVITNVQDKVVFNGTLNDNGELDWVVVQEYTQVRTSRLDYTRHNFTASENGITGFSGATVNKNVNIRIILQDLINDPVLVIENPVDNGIYNSSFVYTNGTALDPESGIYQVSVWPQGKNEKIADGTEQWDAWLNLTDGKWTITFNATNFAGVVKRQTLSITVDTVPPMLVVDYPHATELVNTTDINFTGKTEPGAVVTVNGFLATVDAGGNFSRNITLPEGVNTVTVASHDKAMNFNYSKPVVTVDITPPPLTVFTPVDKLITPESTLIATGAVESDATLSVNGIPIAHTGEPFSKVVTLTEGVNTLRFLAMDPAGNRNVTVREVIYDPTAPDVKVYNPPGSALTNVTSINITGMAKDLTLSRVTVNGVNVTPDSAGNYSLVVALTEGLNEIEVTGYDMAGHVTIVRRLVTLDTIAPPLEVFQPTDGLLTKNPTLHVIGATEIGAKITVSGTNATVDSQGHFDYTMTLKEGANTVTVIAKDPAGNPTVIKRAVTLDTQPPVITLSTPKKGLSVTEVELSVKGSVTDNIAVAKVTVNGKVVTVTNGKFSTSIPIKKGDTKVIIEATDTAGNVATQEVKVNRGALTIAEAGLLVMGIILMVVGLILGVMIAKRKLKGPPAKDDEAGASRFDEEGEAGTEPEEKEAPKVAPVKKERPKVQPTEPEKKVDDKIAPGPPKDASKPPEAPPAPKPPEVKPPTDKPTPEQKGDIEDIMKKLKT